MQVLDTHIFHSFLRDRLNKKWDAFSRMEQNTRDNAHRYDEGMAAGGGVWGVGGNQAALRDTMWKLGEISAAEAARLTSWLWL